MPIRARIVLALTGVAATLVFNFVGTSGAAAQEALSLPHKTGETLASDAESLPPSVSETVQVLEPPQPLAATAERRAIDFEANDIAYDSDNNVVTASGTVILRSEDRSLRAEQVVWNRTTGQISATGNIRFVDQDGSQIFTDQIELTDKFEAGAMKELLIALSEGGRLAARGGARQKDGSIALTTAAYSACAVTDSNGCRKDPSWRITAKRVIYNPETKKIDFDGAFLELFGARLLPLPGLKVGTDGKAISGIMVPGLRFSKSNGVEIQGGYYWRLAADRDLTVKTYVFSGVAPMVSANWRHLTGKGAYQVTGYGTASNRISQFGTTSTSKRGFRGYLEANGKFQFDRKWSVTGSVRLASDRTFLRRYDVSRDDRLRSTVNVERISETSYFSLAGWATQTMRIGTSQGQVPLAVPVIDYRKRFNDPTGLGGRLELQANTLAIERNDGQDTRRAFGGARWDLSKLTGLGQVITVTGLVRGDVYHSSDNALTATAIYRGNSGWQTRAIAVGAVDMQWPFVGNAFGGTQVFTPRVQLVAAPPIRNLAMPNEDARAIDLEDSNLFALNRFPGYDRIEDGVRATYGFDWELRRPGWRVKATVGQSYRLKEDRSVLIDGTGIGGRFSDFVGRSELRFRDLVSLTHRYRLDKDSFAVRRNEFDATIGDKRTYVEAGYVRLNRDIAARIEDLQDREELRLAARIAFAKYWSVFGSSVVNLTDSDEDETLISDGFEAVRTRLGIAYKDDCLEIGLTWRRDHSDRGDAQKGSTFQLFFALRNLGFR